MWHQLFNSGLLKDAGIFAGAYMTLQMVHRMRSTDVDPIFDDYPYTRAFNYVPILCPLLKMEQPSALREVLRQLEQFLETAAKSDVRRHGFEVNRTGNMVVHQTKQLIERAKRSSSNTLAIAAMDYERDELPVLEGMVDDTMRNMLLAHE